jgi:hypothetical protein
LPIASRQRGRLRIDYSNFYSPAGRYGTHDKAAGIRLRCSYRSVVGGHFWTDPAPGAIITAAAPTIVTVIAGALPVLS